MLSSGKDIEARVFAVFECRRVPCRNPWDTKRATAGSSGGAELCRILLVFVSQREINVLGERRPRQADFDGASARALHRRGGWALFFSTTDLRSAFGTELLDLTVGPRQTVTPRRPHCSVGVDDLAVGRSVD